MRFHLLGLAHLPTHKSMTACAYTQKIVRLGKMLKDSGHKVIFYGGEGSEVECEESVQVLSEQDRIDCYGAYDHKKEFFKLDGGDACYTKFNKNAISEIWKRKEDKDVLLCPMGCWHQPIADATGLLAVESGIGYEGVFSNYKVFESYAWMHWVYGKRNIVNGLYYDAVIPNYFDLESFPFQEKKGDYCLFIGRLVSRKGVDVAVEVTKRLGMKLIVAGQGSLVNPKENLNITASHVEHIGCVGAEERARLMGGARLCFAPTYYIEPFGGVAVEAQLCGTPVLASDWGAFTETVLHGVTGYRCRTLEEFVWAAKDGVDNLDPKVIRKWAEDNYGVERVTQMYNEYFKQIAGLWGKGWYEENDSRTSLDGLTKFYPMA